MINLTDEQRAAIVRLDKEGMSRHLIARRFGLLSFAQVRQVIRTERRRLENPRPAQRKIGRPANSAQDDEIIELYEAGTPVAELARRYGCKAETMRSRLNRLCPKQEAAFKINVLVEKQAFAGVQFENDPRARFVGRKVWISRRLPSAVQRASSAYTAMVA